MNTRRPITDVVRVKDSDGAPQSLPVLAPEKNQEPDAPLLRRMLEAAFEAGHVWGITYRGWFSPTDAEHTERRDKDLHDILQKVAKGEEPTADN